jgi:hypothetical protein
MPRVTGTSGCASNSSMRGMRLPAPRAVSRVVPPPLASPLLDLLSERIERSSALMRRLRAIHSA